MEMILTAEDASKCARLISEVAGGFTGTIIGLFAVNENSNGIGRFENLSVRHDVC